MEKEKISNGEIGALGIEDLELLVAFSRVANGLLKHEVMDKANILTNLEALIADPMPYALKRNGKFKNIADRVIALRKDGRFVKQIRSIHKLKEEIADFPVFGLEHIEVGALAQMKTAIQLPIAVAGALMPDAHQGYGLPIGGVLATTADTIIPYAVGVDIACRMCLSIFDMPASTVDAEKNKLQKLLGEHTYFGMGSTSARHLDASLFDRAEWNATKSIRSLKTKAYNQLGTSGTGNHFVEWGELSVEEGALEGIPGGNYLALLSHSGSRGFGGNIADIYSKIAMDKTRLPKEAKHLAWLDLNTDEGQEYWIAMNLAGDYASANHHEIHNKIALALKVAPAMRIENHHNFAWKEQLADGTEVMVHRKGATPAGEGVLGIIPGSMSTHGLLLIQLFLPDILTLNKLFLPSSTFRSANPACSNQFNASYTVAGLIFTPLVRSGRRCRSALPVPRSAFYALYQCCISCADRAGWRRMRSWRRSGFQCLRGWRPGWSVCNAG